MDHEEWQEICKEFRKEELKTKHLQKKAEKKKVTRRVKHDKVVMLDHVRHQLMRDVEYQIKHIRQRNAADCDVVAFINKKYAQIRQIMSE